MLGPEPHVGNEADPLEEILNSKPCVLPGGVRCAAMLHATMWGACVDILAIFLGIWMLVGEALLCPLPSFRALLLHGCGISTSCPGFVSVPADTLEMGVRFLLKPESWEAKVVLLNNTIWDESYHIAVLLVRASPLLQGKSFPCKVLLWWESELSTFVGCTCISDCLGESGWSILIK